MRKVAGPIPGRHCTTPSAALARSSVIRDMCVESMCGWWRGVAWRGDVVVCLRELGVHALWRLLRAGSARPKQNLSACVLTSRRRACFLKGRSRRRTRGAAAAGARAPETILSACVLTSRR